nr:hypothetical protein [Actinomycetota bacterium]
ARKPATTLAAAYHSASATRPSTPTPFAGYSSFQDSSFAHAKKAASLPPVWDFSPLTATGETVRVHLSKKLFLGPDTVVAQQWADFFGSLIHGSELATLDAYLLTLREVQSVCGTGALACYGGNQIIAPAQDPAVDLTAQAVVTHEYGHHVAAHRLNDPWEAIDTGTKRWATYEGVCVKTRKGQYFPGAEDEDHYYFNPGEGFAEAYRVLNERSAGLQEAPWDIVTNMLYPDDNAFVLLQQDVTAPWTKNTTLSRAGSVSKKTPLRSYVVSTPLDGSMKVSLRSSAKATFRLDVLSPNLKSLGHATGKNAATSAIVCGDRGLQVRVTRVTGQGSFRLAISRP